MQANNSPKLKTLDEKNLFFSLLALLFLTECLYISLHIFPKSLSVFYNKYILITVFSFIIYFINIKLIDKFNANYNKHLLITIFSFGILFRVTLISLPPFLSDDIYRYIWDGYLQVNGINPYLYAPSSLELIRFRNNDIFPFINHPNLPTIYPPLLQLFFLLAYLIGGNSFITIKIIILIFDIATTLLLVKLLDKLDLPLTKVAIYFLCPLPILEFFISGHIDSIGIFFLILFIYSLLGNKLKLSSFALASSILVKLMPIIFLPIILLKLDKRKLFIFLSLFFSILLLFYLPHYFILKENIFGSFSTFIKDFYFNSSIFSFLYFLTGSDKLAKLIGYLALGIWVLIVAIKSKDFIKAIFWTLVGLYIFSPIVHPWYLTWIVPLLVFIPSKAVFWLIISSQFSYHILITYRSENLWQDSVLIRLIEYVPFFALLSYDLLRLQAKNFNFKFQFLERNQL